MLSWRSSPSPSTGRDTTRVRDSFTPRRVAYAVVALVVVFAAGTIGFRHTLHEGWLQSFYRTVVTTSRAGPRADRVLRLGRRQPLHHAQRTRGAVGPADRRPRLGRGCRAQAAAGRSRPRRPAVLDRRQGDGEPRPAPAGGGLPRHRHVG